MCMYFKKQNSTGQNMDEYQNMFEKLLFEFNWGQHKPENQIKNILEMPLLLTKVPSEGDIEDHMAKYHNWIATIYQVKGEKATEMLNEHAVITFRRAALGVLQSRIKTEQPDHPINVIYAMDCQAYREKGLFLSPPANGLKLIFSFSVKNFFVKKPHSGKKPKTKTLKAGKK